MHVCSREWFVLATGLFEIGPNTVNSVPREAKLEIDIRDINATRRDAIVASVLQVRGLGHTTGAV